MTRWLYREDDGEHENLTESAEMIEIGECDDDDELTDDSLDDLEMLCKWLLQDDECVGAIARVLDKDGDDCFEANGDFGGDANEEEEAVAEECIQAFLESQYRVLGGQG